MVGTFFWKSMGGLPVGPGHFYFHWIMRLSWSIIGVGGTGRLANQRWKLRTHSYIFDFAVDLVSMGNKTEC